MDKYYYPIVHLLLILFTFCSCEENSNYKNMEMIHEEIAAPTPATKSSIERKLIKKGTIEFEVSHLTNTRKRIFQAVKKYNAYVSSDQEFKSTSRNSHTIIIRVPSEKFDLLLKDATHGIEKFDRKEIIVTDVTEEFLDIQARLKTKKELEQRFIAILQKAKNVTEILEIEKEIGKLRSDIESIEGRLRYLQDKISFSTLTLDFYKPIPNNIQFGKQFKDAFINGWNNFIWFLVSLTHIWVFILMGLGLIVGRFIFIKRK